MKPLLEGRAGRFLVGLGPYAWLLLFFLVPFLIVAKISLSEPQMGIPPYLPLVDWAAGAWKGTLAGYRTLTGDDLYILAYLGSLKLAAISTLGCLLLGYPAAYAIARSPKAHRQGLLMLVALPFWTSFLIRVYAWIGILKDEGLLNMALMGLGITQAPLQILETNTAVVIGMVYSYLPFMILPLYATLEKMDLSLLEAAADLGCKPFRAFLAITLPLSVPGIIAGCMLVFIPAVGEFVIPDLLGGPDTLVIGKVLWAEFFDNRDWPTASAVAVAMLVLLVVPIMIFQHFEAIRAEREE
jgi:putrescine transport system permease protein